MYTYAYTHAHTHAYTDAHIYLYAEFTSNEVKNYSCTFWYFLNVTSYFYVVY